MRALEGLTCCTVSLRACFACLPLLGQVDLVACVPRARLFRARCYLMPYGEHTPAGSMCTPKSTHVRMLCGVVAELVTDFPSVDFSELEPDDPYWTEAREPWSDIATRANAFIARVWVRAL